MILVFAVKLLKIKEMSVARLYKEGFKYFSKNSSLQSDY